jgi:hypothetical protein
MSIAEHAAGEQAGRVSCMVRFKAMAKIAFLSGNSRKTYGCVTPPRPAIAAVLVS